MKKIVLIVVLIASLSLLLVGCATPDVPGSAWAQKEVLTYDVMKQGGETPEGEKIGECVTTITRVSGKTVLKNNDNKEYTLSANGTHYSAITTDNDGKVIMESEIIMDGFKPVASFKSVNYGDKDYRTLGEYGSSYTYTLTDNKAGGTAVTKTVGLSGVYMDNDFLYMYIRCYTLENINKQFSVITPADGVATNVSVVATGEGKQKIKRIGATETTEFDITKVEIRRTSIPVGSSISVVYSKYDAAKDTGDYVGNFGSKTSKNYHVPIMILENNIAYRLQKVEGAEGYVLDGNAIQVTTSK